MIELGNKIPIVELENLDICGRIENAILRNIRHITSYQLQ